jgi:hypothetical protein
MDTTQGRRHIGSAAALSLALGLAACGGGDATEATTAAGEAQQIDITAVDYEFEGVPETLERGPVEISMVNEGEEDHMVILAKINEGHTVEEALKAEGEKGTATELGTIPPTKPGEEAASTLSADITEPGEYVLLCPLETKDKEPHYDLGQLYEYEVE